MAATAARVHDALDRAFAKVMPEFANCFSLGVLTSVAP